MLVGREKEVEFLLQVLEKPNPQLIAVYGRRRIGKTFLIRETYGQMFSFQHAGVYSGSRDQQLKEFYISLIRAGLFEDFQMPIDWIEAFDLLRRLTEQSRRAKKILFIDELSWMDTPKSDFLMALESFWNGWASAHNDVILILCSSATSWMLNKIVHNKGGLYNRLTGQLHLMPFSLADCKLFSENKNLKFQDREILELYMVLGGIPFYWEFLEKGLSVAQNIDRLFFEPDAQLKLEYDHLFSSLFRHPEGYVRIIHALAGKRTGLTRGEIAQKTKMSPSGNLTKKLKELESCGFIREYNGYGKKTKDSIFQLIDPFVLFYHHFLSSKPRDPAFWTHQLNTPAQNNWKGLAFEQICLLHVEQIKKTLGISMIHTDVFSFYCESNPDLGLFGSQIDMIIWRADRVINLLEMKYNTGLYLITKKQDQAMQNKMHDFITVTKTRDAVHLTLVTAYGVTPNIYSNGIQSQVTMKDLFQRI